MERRIKNSLVAAAAALSLPCAAYAHAGHHDPASGSGGLVHALTHFDHLAVVVLVGAVVVAATNAFGALIVRLRRRRAALSAVRHNRDLL
jgi:hydrogenase/urease accessory protein HupE